MNQKIYVYIYVEKHNNNKLKLPRAREFLWPLLSAEIPRQKYIFIFRTIFL